MAGSIITEYGFEASFISDVPDYLKCVVCHLVLRDPIQIMRCGHRFCTTCFDRIKGYAQHMSTELLCPIDREKIELDKVFDDTGIARVIGNLSVKCHNYINGCIWTGDLRDLEAHYLDCGCNQISHPEPDSQNVPALLENLSSRMIAFEDFKLKSEKETALLKYTLHEFKTKSAHKEAELIGLKAKLASLEHEIVVVRDSNKELKNTHNREIENMSLKGQLMEVKVESLQTKFKELYEIMDEKVNSLQSQLNKSDKTLGKNSDAKEDDNLNELMSSIELNLTQSQNEVKSTKTKAKKKPKQNGNIETRSIEQLNQVFTELREEVDLKFNLLSDQTIEAISAVKESKTDKQTNIQSNNVSEDTLENLKNNIDELTSHVTNIENIIFCDCSKGSMNLVLKWKLHNFESHCSSGGGYIYSPIFYTQFRGYCFQLYANISGQNSEKIGIYLSLCRAFSNTNEFLEPFNMPYKLEIMDTLGKKIESHIQLAEIERNRDRYFTIPKCEKKVKGGFGYSFHTDDLNIKDMLFIKCTIMPSV